MPEVPFLNYHTSLLLSKLRDGHDITAHDINQAMYGSSINMLVEPYFAYNARRTVVFHGRKDVIRRNNAYLRRFRSVRNATTYKARFKRRSSFQSWQRPVSYYSRSRSYQRGSLWRRSISGKRRRSGRYSY